MKAVVFKAPNVFDYEEISKPSCPDDGLLIKIEAVGLCGSDLRTFACGHSNVDPPHIIGHEVAGIVEETGDRSSGFKTGDRVLVNPIIPCGECYYCKQGLENHCSNRIFVGTDIPGGYAQYIAVPGAAIKNDCVLQLDESVPFEQAPLAETLASVINSQKHINVKDGDVVVIIGAGPIGCLHAEVAKSRGAKKVIMSEINDSRLDIVRRFDSIDITVNSSKEDLKQVILNETDNLGADVIIVACPVGKAQEQAVDMVKPRGKVLFFGGLPKDNCNICIDSNKIHYNEIALFGAFAYTPREFKDALSLITQKKIRSSKFITDVLPLSNIKEGINIARQGLGIKVVLKPWD